MPSWIMRSAVAMADCLPRDRILVILQQAGGNDGLNTVIPRTDSNYYAARSNIQVPYGSEINLDGSNGLHPALEKLANWFNNGKLGIINNVGYENPSLSHFTSTDYWEYGSSPAEVLPQQGWGARFFNTACPQANVDSLFAVVAGKSGSTPDALSGMTGYTPPTISSPDAYQLSADSDETLRFSAIEAVSNISTSDPQIDFLQQSQKAVFDSTADIKVASQVPLLVPEGSYTDDSLGRGLKLASQIIRAGFSTRIFYVTQGGYDTHANQGDSADPLNTGSHPSLLSALSSCFDAFLTEMDLSGNLDRVLVMTFSEFGRRVAENGSNGTDHGAGNCMFVAGGKVIGGIYGGQPDLNPANLIQGNLKYVIDFRSVYARIMESWFGVRAAPILGRDVYNSVIYPQLSEIVFIDDIPTDFNKDNRVDLKDHSLLASDWDKQDVDSIADTSSPLDRKVEIDDLNNLANQWLQH